MDAKLHFDSKVDWIDWENDDLISCGDWQSNFDIQWNGFSANTQYHPAKLHIIALSVSRIKEKYYSLMLGLTGPAAVTDGMVAGDMMPVNKFFCQMLLDRYTEDDGGRGEVMSVYINKKPWDK